ncbi:MAG: ArnT family glycosyltransferase [Myxococcota bacterium]
MTEWNQAEQLKEPIRVAGGGWPDRGVAIALFLGTVVLVGLTAEDIGYTRDEGYYFKAGELYWGWFRELGRSFAQFEWSRPFTKAVIDSHLSYNPEHPVLVKFGLALSFGLLKETFGVFENAGTAFRFPAWLFAGFSVAIVFRLAREFLPIRSSVFAALLWLSLPRAFWHMHLACFDIPVVAAHTWLVLAYWRGRRTVGGAIVVGVVFGLAAAVKHNVLLAPAFFVLHWLLTEAPLPKANATGLSFPPIPLVFISMALLGPLVFLLHWPYLWPDPIFRYGSYLGFHLQHEHYPILYFGDLLTQPPFPISFPFVMSAVTLPVPALVMIVLGALLAAVLSIRFLAQRVQRLPASELSLVRLGTDAREPSASAAILLLLQAAFPFVLIALPSSPIFGGTKHWMNALPFLCVLAAFAMEEGIQRLARAVTRLSYKQWNVVATCLSLAICVPGVLITVRSHPYGLASYNELIGFARGAANIGMQRSFWGYESRLALPIVNRRTEQGGRIHFGDTNYDDWRFYRRDGLLREDLQWSPRVRGSHVAAVQPQGEFKEQWMDVLNEWKRFGPDEVLHIDGVPLLTLTFRPEQQ